MSQSLSKSDAPGHLRRSSRSVKPFKSCLVYPDCCLQTKHDLNGLTLLLDRRKWPGAIGFRTTTEICDLSRATILRGSDRICGCKPLNPSAETTKKMIAIVLTDVCKRAETMESLRSKSADVNTAATAEIEHFFCGYFCDL
jgi:hypothetical protein